MPIPCVNLIFPFGSDFPNVYCPVCGANVQKTDEPIVLPSCEHMEFCYLDITGDFEYANKFMTKKIEEFSNEDDTEEFDVDNSEILDKMKDEIDGQTRMILEITTSGMGCTGPASSTVTFGFNFLPEN